MRALHALLLLLAGAAFASDARAQIYECVGEDGSRVFSDERCGPDAKVVTGVTSKKRPTAKAPSAPKPKKVVKAAGELEALSAQCDAGDMKACKEWTLSGGPALLKEKERQTEADCEGGSLAACEERYCQRGVSEDCRARVLRTAKLAGEEWYLREEVRGQPDGLARYHIRCVPPNAKPRDITILCAALPGPNRCYLKDAQQGFARLDRAAGKHCSDEERNRVAAKDRKKEQINSTDRQVRSRTPTRIAHTLLDLDI